MKYTKDQVIRLWMIPLSSKKSARIKDFRAEYAKKGGDPSKIKTRRDFLNLMQEVECTS